MNELEQLLKTEKSGRMIWLKGDYKLNLSQGQSFTIGKMCMKGLLNIREADLVIDGSDAVLEAEVEDSTGSDWALIFVHPSARNVTLRNLYMRISVKNPSHSQRMLSAIYNTAFGLKMENCRIEMQSDKQIMLAGIYNNGNLDTHLETRADNLVIDNSFIKISCLAEEFPKENAVYGIYNNLANSISVQNTYVYAVTRGDGERQKAAGVYTNGRFGRYVGNNIKANGTHNIGKQKEQAHAYGFINEGLYTLITSNNIVGEWAGMCVGLENRGEYTVVSSNKILSTHTICGRSIRNYGNNSSIEGNILTSTSRNARLLEQEAKNCIITGNIMEVLMAREECQSGCGIYAGSEEATGNLISGNVIRNVSDCGIYAVSGAGILKDNIVNSYEGTIEYGSPRNLALAERLDEGRICSIYG